MRTVQTPWLKAPAARRTAAGLGAGQARVVSRRQLVQARVPRWVIRAQVSAGRWQNAPGHTVVLHNGPLAESELRWIAVLGVCPRAALDGVTALQQAGVKGLDDTIRHVIVPRGSDPRKVNGVRVHESRRFRETDLVAGGIRRTRPAVAAVHAALWAASDRQAQLFVLMCVQQRRASVEQIADAVHAVRRHPRRKLLRHLVMDLTGGVQSLGELDVAKDLHGRGLPEPDRQAVRKRPSGTEYLDCEFPAYHLVLEIDGAGHEEPEQKLADFLRDLVTMEEGKSTVRIPLALYRLDRSRVLDHVERLFVARGWQRPAAA